MKIFYTTLLAILVTQASMHAMIADRVARNLAAPLHHIATRAISNELNDKIYRQTEQHKRLMQDWKETKEDEIARQAGVCTQIQASKAQLAELYKQAKLQASTDGQHYNPIDVEKYEAKLRRLLNSGKEQS